MNQTGSASETVNLMHRFGFRAKKKYGQNFLTSDAVLDAIAEDAELSPSDLVLEIGPGLGSLTKRLCEQAGQVKAVEIDGELLPILQAALSEYHNVTICAGDILKMDPVELTEGWNGPVKVVANLPYYITTPILLELIEGRLEYETITVMVQKEVAERMQAGPGSKAYGALSLAVSYHTHPQIRRIVPANAFYPQPGVDSAVITLKRRMEPAVQTLSKDMLFSVIRAAFGQRRKTLVNALYNSGSVSLKKDDIAEAIREIGLSPQIRGEALTLEQFAALSDVLYRKITESPRTPGK